MTELRAKAQELLQALNGSSDVRGAALVTRDGLPALVEFKKPIDPQTLAAMSAAAMAAAETALLELDPSGLDRMVAQGKGVRCTLLGVDDEHLLLVVSSPDDKANDAMLEAQAGLQKLLAG